MRIKQVHAEDKFLTTQVAQMARDIWSEHYASILTPEQIEYMLFKFQSAEAIERALRAGELEYFIISDGADNAGFFAYGPKDGRMFLSKIYIYKDKRGKGLARAALEHVKNAARAAGFKDILLTVNRHNEGSIAAYKALGFVFERTGVTDIGNGYVMDDYFMALPI